MEDTTEETTIEVSGGHNQVAANVGHQVQNFYGDQFAEKLLQSREHPITVVVTGPEVDTPLGIPIPQNLIPRIADYLTTDEGKAVDAALRKAIGRVHFHFDKFVEKAIDNLAKNLDSELLDICRNVTAELDRNTSLSDDHRKLGRLVLRLFHKIIEVKENASIDPETEALIGEVLGTVVSDEAIIDFSRLSYTGTFKTIITEILQRSIHEHDNPILRHVYRNILDIRQLLSRYFYGFYEGRDNNIRDYMYISWMLWAYLVSEEQRIAARAAAGVTDAMPGVYSCLQDKQHMQLVTFCYTTFASRCAHDALYFHGQLTDYVDVENKNDIHLDDILHLDLVDFFETRLSREISFGDKEFGIRRALPIPSFLPPLKLMPVISQRYIDAWYKTGEMLRHAERIMLLGCPPDVLDGYFADMLRQSEAREIIVTASDLHHVSRHLCTIFQLAPDAYTLCEYAGHTARKYHNRITVVEASPADILQ